MGVSLISVILVVPFGINNILQGRTLLGLMCVAITLLCIITAWFCYHGKYFLSISVLGLAPMITFAIALAVYRQGDVASYWVFAGVLSLYFILPEKQAWGANVLFLAINLPVSWYVLEQASFIRLFAVLIGVSFYASYSIREINKQHALLKEQVARDPLTGLYNRSLLRSSLEQAINVNRRTDIPVSLLMLDIDDFKLVNDQLGHDVGDSSLKAIGYALHSYFRDSDMVFRVGGEEFLVLLYNSNKANSTIIAEKLRKKIEKQSLIPDRNLTVSIGVSELKSEMGWEAWMKRCDNNLYLAKSRGRNRVVS
ncbi:MAG: sensor domain-containing diguanylate cyclase [Gammaproteobacteria bacterium]|nr:sensor domain-containing diguanylate cyclase [Gammaproteobacteria bacterium]